MRTFVFSVILFSLILLAITLNSIYIHCACDEMKEIISSRDVDEKVRAERLCDAWSAHKRFFSLSVHESQIERMDDVTQGLKSATANCDRADFEKHLFLLKELLEEFPSNERVSLQGIV